MLHSHGECITEPLYPVLFLTNGQSSRFDPRQVSKTTIKLIILYTNITKKK